MSTTDLINGLVAIAAHRYGVPPSALMSGSRAAEICRARNAVWRALRIAGWSYPSIAAAWGYACHATIINGCKNAAAFIRHADPVFLSLMGDLTTYLLTPSRP